MRWLPGGAEGVEANSYQLNAETETKEEGIVMVLRFQQRMMDWQRPLTHREPRGSFWEWKEFLTVWSFPIQLLSLKSKIVCAVERCFYFKYDGNEILGLLEAHITDFGVMDIFHLALVMVLLKTDVSNGCLCNVETWPCESSLPWKKRSPAFFWLLCPSCTFITTENLLCTCSNWVLSDKHLASLENCSIKSQPQLWGSTITGSPLRGVAFPIPRGRVLSPLAAFQAWTPA